MYYRASSLYTLLLVGSCILDGCSSFSVQSQRVFVSTPASKYPKRVVADYMEPIRHVLRPEMSIDETLQAFVSLNLSAAPVVDESSSLIGIVSSFDFLQKEAFGGALLPMGGSQELVEKYVEAAKKICGQKVEDVMSTNPVTVTTTTPMRDAAALMAEQRIQRLPVLDKNKKLVGMLTSIHIMQDLMYVMNKLPAAKEE